MRKFTPDKAKTIPEQAECKFRGELFEVYQWPQEMFDGSTATFEMLKREDTVVIIALLTPEEQRRLRGNGECDEGESGNGRNDGDGGYDQDRVVITYQTQPRQDWYYGYPGGRHDNPEETELEAAKRELREETGLSFRDWRLVEVRQPLAKLDWLVYTFVATDFMDCVAQKLDAGEKIEVLELTFDELREYGKKPNAERLIPDFMREIRSLDELRKMPRLYEY